MEVLGPQYQQYNRLLDWVNRTEGLQGLHHTGDTRLQDCRLVPTACGPARGPADINNQVLREYTSKVDGLNKKTEKKEREEQLAAKTRVQVEIIEQGSAALLCAKAVALAHCSSA